MPIISPDRQSPTYLINPDLRSWSMALSSLALAVLVLVSPRDWFGASWNYFPQFHSVGWLGWILGAVAWHQICLLYLHAKANIIGYLFFMGGFVTAAVGALILVSGLWGHMGLMEAPLCFWVAIQKFIHSADLIAIYNKAKKEEVPIAEDPITVVEKTRTAIQQANVAIEKP